jgi:hypothetical protein
MKSTYTSDGRVAGERSGASSSLRCFGSKIRSSFRFRSLHGFNGFTPIRILAVRITSWAITSRLSHLCRPPSHTHIYLYLSSPIPIALVVEAQPRYLNLIPYYVA